MSPLRVAVRIRPIQKHDKEAPGAPPCLEPVASEDGIPPTELQLAKDSPRHRLAFDRVFPQKATQEEVFRDIAFPLVQPVLEGVNACVFAFGNTGAGKTFSMIGPEGGRDGGSGAMRRQDDGILPRVAAELFRRIARMEAEADALLSDQSSGGGSAAQSFSAYQVRCQFLEVHRENVFDLLGGPVSASRESGCGLSLREDAADGGRGVFAEKATEVNVTSAEQLLSLVRLGADARSTVATGVHAHSSRSHAMLVLSVEHRWREVKVHRGAAKNDDESASAFKSQTARFTLVDLAGAESMESSHGGEVDRSGTATNLGLLALGRVITALAEQRKSESGSRVPYRDSTLTRLMQSSLCGAAQTVMLACVSPASREAGFTARNLQYALSARKVNLKPRAAKILDDEPEPDPMHGDVDDAECPHLDRRCITIECGAFGDVFARVVGDAAEGALILYVHGSGPRNSSMVWNHCATELQERALAAREPLSRGFFHVAIDCPGYGRSRPGVCQTIRSHPGAFLRAVVSALGRRSCACLVGSSQGAAATLNAVLEYPGLADTVALCHPVTHAPLERFRDLPQPALMAYDTRDDGHPVSVGRTLRSKVQNPNYHEYDGEAERDWLSKNFAREMWETLRASWKGDFSRKRNGGKRVMQMPDLTRVAGGLRCWERRHGHEVLPWYGWYEDASERTALHRNLESTLAEGAAAGEEQDQTADPGNTWRAMLEPATNMIVYENLQTGRRTKIRPNNGHVIVNRLTASPAESNSTGEKLRLPDIERGRLFSDSSDSSLETEAERKERKQKEANAQKQKEAEQESCDLCRKPLITKSSSVRLAKCRCALCPCCVERTVLYTRQCPCCGDAPLKAHSRTGAVVSDPGELEVEQAALRHRHYHQGGHIGQLDRALLAVQAQYEYLSQLQLERSQSHRVILEYGNTASPGATKTKYVTFLDAWNPSVWQKAGLAVSRVEFNINPRYDKPTTTVTKASATSIASGRACRFQFEYSMGRAFPCWMTCHFEERQLPSIRIPYYVHDDELFMRRIVIQVPICDVGSGAGTATKASYRSKLKKDVVLDFRDEFENSVCSNVWIRFSPDKSAPEVEYLPEAEGAIEE